MCRKCGISLCKGGHSHFHGFPHRGPTGVPERFCFFFQYLIIHYRSLYKIHPHPLVHINYNIFFCLTYIPFNLYRFGNKVLT